MTSFGGRRASTAAFLAFTAVVVLWAAGAFRGGLVEPGRGPSPEGLAPPAATAVAGRIPVPVHDDAVGTVQSRSRVAVAAQVMARVLEIRASVGDAVRKGDALIVLDDREFRARADQAREAVAAAEAAKAQAGQARTRAGAELARAEASRDRVRSFLGKGAATDEQMEAAESAFLQARAAVAEAEAAVSLAGARAAQARQVAAETEVALGYARVAAPQGGVVVERAAEPGDLAVPGAPLLVLLDPVALRLEARVREGLVSRVRPGDVLEIAVPAAGRAVRGVVANVVPAADPRTRSFEVRVDFGAVEGVYPGMFGRLRLPAGTREAVHVPAAAVTRVGQIATVAVREEGGWFRRLVTIGRDLGEGRVEVLSGLAGGETVGMP